MVVCLCGCLTKIPDRDERGRKRTYVHGHTNRGKSNTWKIKSEIKKRTSRGRAVKAKIKVKRCEWSKIGGCLGRLDVAHIDGDSFNNSPENILKLCRCHHRLMDNKKIDPTSPKMPPFIVSGGKRRYL